MFVENFSLILAKVVSWKMTIGKWGKLGEEKRVEKMEKSLLHAEKTILTSGLSGQKISLLTP